MRREASLRRRADFRRVMAGGSRTRVGDMVVVTARRSEPSAPARLGLSVGTRRGSAVVRNRIKRRLRAAFTAAEPPPGVDVVVRATDGVLVISFQELVDRWQRALRGQRRGAHRTSS
jgi:ribonuclease P protein component